MTTKKYSQLITRLIVLLFLAAMAPVYPASQPTSNIKKVFSCAYEGCSKNFNKKSNLTRHFKTHTGERPFACTYPDCKKKFTNKHHLTAHFRIHTGERPYKCSYQSCTKAFAEKSSLKKHLKTHIEKKTYTACIPKTISKEAKQINNTQFHLLAATQAKLKDTNVQGSKIDSHDELNPQPCIDISTLLAALLLLKIQLQDADIIKQLRSASYQDQLIKIAPFLQDLLNNPDNSSPCSSEQHNQHLAKLIKSFDKKFLQEILFAIEPCPTCFNNQESLS